MKFMCLDIETVPQARFLDPEQYAGLGRGGSPFRLDPEWADAAFQDKRFDPFEVLAIAVRRGDGVVAETKVVPALHATTCHIVQVSFGWRQDEGIVRRVLQTDSFFRGLDKPFDPATVDVATGERLLLTEALDVVARAVEKRTTLVSFNGKSFDLPVLRARAALLRLNVSRLPWRRLLYPYSDDQHADLRLILGADDRRARGTLQWWSQAFGVQAEEHGAEVGAWVRAGEWDKLRAYGETEARTLVELFEAVEPVL